MLPADTAQEGTCRPHLPEHERQKLDEYDKFPQDFWISSTPGDPTISG